MLIRDFAERYKLDGYPHDAALMKNVYLTDVSTSTLVFDKGDFLVELYFMHPLVKIVPHSHPFENVAIHIGGSMWGSREGAIGHWLTPNDSGSISGVLLPGSWHAFETGERGAVLYNISKWATKADKDSATLRYSGAPLGPLHQATLAKAAGD